MILLLEMDPKCSTRMLFGLSEHKKAVMCPTEKTHVLDKFHFRLSFSAIGCEFNTINQKHLLNNMP